MEPGTTADVEGITHHCDDNEGNIQYYTTGCYINEQRDLRVNEDVIENNMVYRCYKRSGVIHYEEYACGFRGMPACNPQPIDPTAEEKDLLQRGLKAPGFGSFSIVQVSTSH
uniref:Beta_helix domain-containing protein n=1 Tax=Ascaris lumbricoides TaxID=6252 RepID=A0A0M3HFL2_ASCLU